MRRYVTSLVALCAVFLADARAADIAVPRDLEPWRAWVLDGEEYRRCPFMASASPADKHSYRCAWPERLALSLDARGGTFEQHWQVFAESWVRLPGNIEHWPQEVHIDGAPGAVVTREGFPSLRLLPGTHAVSGQLSWSTRPESIAIDSRTALVGLTLDGKRVEQPERPDGAVWLGKRRSAEQPARMEVQVYRLLRDSVPAMLLTRIRLQVSGDGREELLAHVLPDGFTPLSLQSPLQARLESDGKLRVQVRAGSWDIDLDARGTGVANRIARPPTPDGLWAREEVWSFAGDDRLRVASAQGADGIDPTQANVPSEWRGYPAFRMAADAALEITERSRGLANVDDNRLSLRRVLWLDFDGRGFTSVDQLNGTLRKDWRLEMTGPYSLESARAMDGDPLLITRNPRGQGSGLEVRTPTLAVQAVARTAGSRERLPATGWNSRFDDVSGVLRLPPGHRLLAALGADEAPGAWVERWGLWGVFGVLVVAVCAGWLAGPVIGAVAFVALMLTYQESPGYIWLWINLLAALALARAAPEGLLRRFAGTYRAASFVILGVALLPLLGEQARLALHPQLESTALAVPASAPGQGNVMEVTVAGARRKDAGALPQTMNAPAAVMLDIAPPAEADDALEEATPVVEQPYAAGKIISGLTGLNSAQVVQRYAPGTLVQAGPGIPAWSYVTYSYRWQGPVEPGQSVRFLYVGPVLLGLWRIAGIVLLAALFVALLNTSNAGRWRWPDTRAALARWFKGPVTSATGLSLALLLLLTLAVARPVEAQQNAPSRADSASMPPTEILEELKSRLTRSPACTPSCAEITAAHVTVHGDRLEVSLSVSALAPIAIPVPTARDRWQLDAVTLDGRATLAVGRESDGTLAIPLTPGAHEIRLSGLLAAATSIQVEFPRTPRAISVSNDGWDVSGVNEGRLLSGSLELVRRGGSTGTANSSVLAAASEFPAFVRVTRSFELGLDWAVSTVVERVAPEKAAMTLEIPLVPGESVLSDSLRTRDLPGGSRLALVGLERNQRVMGWQSGLPRSETLELELPADAARSEVWTFVVNPQWNVTFEGLPAVLPEATDLRTWIYEFHPRPGEKLHLSITRPERAAGATLAIDSVSRSVAFGKRSATSTLEWRYRSTQGGRHVITLPKSARVSAVLLDGQPASSRPDDGALSIGLLPGAHIVNVQWEDPIGAGVYTQPPAVDLNSPASNVRTTLVLPADRWLLFVSGKGVGPAVLYWSELLVFVIVALLLGRWRRSPLRTHEWLLLGLGLSTLSWGVLAIVGLWLFAVGWRERWSAETSRVRFNLVQGALAVATVVAVTALVFWGIRESLLASPDMGITGPGSYGAELAWFLDRTDSALPQPTIISLPLWAYRALMFAWALWLVVALLRWLRWAWRAWKTHGIWRSKVEEEVPAVS